MATPAGELAPQSLSVVTQGSMLGLADFNFNMDQPQPPPPPPHPHPHHPFFGGGAPGPAEYLFSPGIPDRVDDFPPQASFADLWNSNNRFLPSSSSVYPDIPAVPPFISPSPILNSSLQGSLSSVPLRKRQQQPPSGRPRSARHGSRQIALRHHPRPPPSSIAEGATVHWMARFSEIHSRLLELSGSLPSPDATAQSPALGRPADERFRGSGFPVDEVFGLTGTVADIFEELCSADEPSTMQSRIDSSEPGNSLFALSMYVRILDIFQKIFSLVRRELAHAESHVEFRYWKLPDVSIGSIEVDSSPRFQMFLAVQVALQFLTRLRKSATVLHSSAALDNGMQPSRGPNGTSMFTGSVDNTITAIQSQEAALANFLSELRVELEVFRDSVEFEDDESS
ncbi:hypothetical protein B0I35DRAFT_429346 [Stachybotrys elegans]|uniref:Aflatoxin regulatory protein domain-containing protein n=1 Tax=Stachybotrys elegans TaxID=80388 RepID=A0A8K0WRI6_9HYPO|nr:hypothetical protein B0I35DRAFT_429346 [Stachybotrys elegans]